MRNAGAEVVAVKRSQWAELFQRFIFLAGVDDNRCYCAVWIGINLKQPSILDRVVLAVCDNAIDIFYRKSLVNGMQHSSPVRG